MRQERSVVSQVADQTTGPLGTYVGGKGNCSRESGRFVMCQHILLVSHSRIIRKDSVTSNKENGVVYVGKVGFTSWPSVADSRSLKIPPQWSTGCSST